MTDKMMIDLLHIAHVYYSHNATNYRRLSSSNEIRTLLDATKELEENGGEPLTTPPSADNKYHKQLLSELLIHRWDFLCG